MKKFTHSVISVLHVANCKGFMKSTRRIDSFHKSAVVFNVY